jgi:hypothetical protein
MSGTIIKQTSELRAHALRPQHAAMQQAGQGEVMDEARTGKNLVRR